MSHDPTDKAGFEKWANTQGLVLTAAQGVDLMFRTYEDWNTEFAWRGWANRPHRTTHVSVAQLWPTPQGMPIESCKARFNSLQPVGEGPVIPVEGVALKTTPQIDAAYSALTQIRKFADDKGDEALQQLLTSLGVHP